MGESKDLAVNTTGYALPDHKNCCRTKFGVSMCRARNALLEKSRESALLGEATGKTIKDVLEKMGTLTGSLSTVIGLDKGREITGTLAAKLNWVVTLPGMILIP